MSEVNILIRYTKWIIKWLFIILIFTSLVFGGFIYYDDYQNQLIPMTTLKCSKVFNDELSEEENKTLNEDGYHFMIKKRRKSEFPEGIYRSPHIRENKVTKNTEVTDLVEVKPFYESKGDLYIFKESYDNKYDYRLEVNRKDLSIEVKKSSPSGEEHKTFYKWECELITPEEFYKSEEIKLNKLKQELII